MTIPPQVARPRRRATPFLLAWGVLLTGLASWWSVRPFFDAATWSNLALGVLFVTSKIATLLCLDTRSWKDLPTGRLLAYLFWPGMQPGQFLKSAPVVSAELRPTWRWCLIDFAIGCVFLWGLPFLLPDATPLVVRVWIGLIGNFMILMFAIFDAWGLMYRSWGIEVEKLWVCPIASTSIAEFWGVRWNRIFSGMLREMLFRPLAPRVGVVGATAAVFFYSGVLHENASVAAGSGFGGPIAYFVIQFLALLVERTRPMRKLLRRSAVLGWLWMALVVLGPAPLLVSRAFLERVALPGLVKMGVTGLAGE